MLILKQHLDVHRTMIDCSDGTGALEQPKSERNLLWQEIANFVH